MGLKINIMIDVLVCFDLCRSCTHGVTVLGDYDVVMSRLMQPG